MAKSTKATGEKGPFVKPTPKNAREAMIRGLGTAIRGGVHGMIPSESEESESVAKKLSKLNAELARSRASHNVSTGLSKHGGLTEDARLVVHAYGTALAGYAKGLLAIASAKATEVPEGEGGEAGDGLDSFFDKAA